MALGRDLRYYPDSILKMPAEPVEEPERWDDLIDDMERLLYEHNGVGLAAPQVGEPVQIFLLRLDLEDRIHETYMNPEILEVRQRESVSEGCLSYPEVQIDVERGREVDFTAVTPGGKEIERTLEGLQAQCVQHEVEHLEGTSLIDHCDLSEKMKIDSALKESGDGPTLEGVGSND